MTITRFVVVSLATLLAGCETMQLASRPKTINGFECYDSPYIKVLQVLENGILAHLCPTNYPSYYDDAFEACAIKGDIVFMEVPQKQNYFVDNQKVTLGKNDCFVGTGTFAYTSSDNQRRTVRSITIVTDKPSSAESAKSSP